MMDQSTQCDFPIVMLKNIKRHNTSADLLLRNSSSSLNSPNSWVHKPQRPKSLNTTPSQRSPLHKSPKIIYYNNNPPGGDFLSVQQLVSSPSISRERTPPFWSPNSSTASLTAYSKKQQQQTEDNHQQRRQDDVCCKCATYSNNDIHNFYRKVPNNSSEGLSWKRLHMSRAKLKATATTSELLSGFAMIAMVELQINEPTSVPEWLFVMFAVCTTILVSVHIFALMISTYILPNIDAIAKLEVCEMVSESPHERMRGFIELAWAFSTVLGLFLFLVEVAILCWVKFWDYSFTAATAATIVVIPVLVIFVLFAVHFYHSLVVYKCDSSESDLEKLEHMKKQLDGVTPV